MVSTTLFFSTRSWSSRPKHPDFLIIALDESNQRPALCDTLLRRYPEYKVKPRPIPTAVPLVRITPEVIAIIDYSKGFGHSDLVRVVESDLEQFIESRRHHWAWNPVD